MKISSMCLTKKHRFYLNNKKFMKLLQLQYQKTGYDTKFTSD